MTDVLGARTGLWGSLLPGSDLAPIWIYHGWRASGRQTTSNRPRSPPQQAPMAKFGPPNFERRTADKIGSARRGRVICRGDAPKSRVRVPLIGRHTSSFAVFRLVLWRWPCLNLGDQKEGTRRGDVQAPSNGSIRGVGGRCRLKERKKVARIAFPVTGAYKY